MITTKVDYVMEYDAWEGDVFLSSNLFPKSSLMMMMMMMNE